jgi:hypothetical protein
MKSERVTTMGEKIKREGETDIKGLGGAGGEDMEVRQ